MGFPKLQGLGENLKKWKWAEALLYWLIYSGGVISGLVLLVASIWISVNSSVHPMTVAIFGGGKAGEAATTNITEMAVTGYVALPELILALAIVTTLSHFQKYRYDKSLKAERLWAILYGIPTVVFLLLTLVTLGCAVLSTTYTQWGWLVVLRALAGYGYGLVSLLHHYIGQTQATKDLQDRDDVIANLRKELVDTVADLHTKNSKYVADIKASYDQAVQDLRQQLLGKDQELAALAQSKERELTFLKQNNELEAARLSQKLEEATREKDQLKSQVISSTEEALGAYSEIVDKWSSQGLKSVKIDTIVADTGIDRRRINSALNKKVLKLAPNTQDKVLMTSLVPWLQTVPTTPALHLVNE